MLERTRRRRKKEEEERLFGMRPDVATAANVKTLILST